MFLFDQNKVKSGTAHCKFLWKVSILFYMLLSLNPLQAQQKNCNVYDAPIRRLPIYCHFTPIKISDDTICVYMSKTCLDWKFDTSATGVWKIYAADSVRLAGIVQLHHGKYNGRVQLFYDNTLTESIIYYENNSFEGPYITYYHNGKLHEDGKTTNRLFEGAVYKYWDNGNLASKEYVCCGNIFPLRTQFWHPEGQVIDALTFHQLWDCKR